MKCKIFKTSETDIAAWVSRGAFMNNVDMNDLACRESKVVYNWYHPDWFRNDDNSELYFIPPAFGFLNGFLHGINGRHRAILLFRHLSVIPLLLVQPNMWPREKLALIVQREIRENEIVELPDLPVNMAIKEPSEQDV